MPKTSASKPALASTKPSNGIDSTVRQRHKKTSKVSRAAKTTPAEPAIVIAPGEEAEAKDDFERKTPHIPSSVIRKLIVFSLLLLIAPILVYFTSLKYVFVGSTAASAITAVIAANMVLVAWVYAAWSEE